MSIALERLRVDTRVQAQAHWLLRTEQRLLSLHVRLGGGSVGRRFAEVDLSLTGVVAHVVVARAVSADPESASKAVILVLVLGVEPALVAERVDPVLAFEDEGEAKQHNTMQQKSSAVTSEEMRPADRTRPFGDRIDDRVASLHC